jgi:uncharacterized membrane protein
MEMWRMRIEERRIPRRLMTSNLMTFNRFLALLPLFIHLALFGTGMAECCSKIYIAKKTQQTCFYPNLKTLYIQIWIRVCRFYTYSEGSGRIMQPFVHM